MNTLIDLLSTYGLILGLTLLFLVIVVWIYRSTTMERYINEGEIHLFGDKKQPPPHHKSTPRPTGL